MKYIFNITYSSLFSSGDITYFHTIEIECINIYEVQLYYTIFKKNKISFSLYVCTYFDNSIPEFIILD